MDKRVTEFREHARARSSRVAPYSEDARGLAVSYALEQIETGARTALVAQTLGVAAATLESWLPRSEPRPRPSLREVTVTTRRTATWRSGSSPVVVMPSGIRVEGLDVAEVVQVLRVLG